MLYDLLSINNVIWIVPGFEYKLSLVEAWSTLLGLWFVIAFRKESLWAYPIGIINSLGFIAIFYQVQLYSDMLLNAYFILISFLGWYWWIKHPPSGPLKIRYLSYDKWVVCLSLIASGSVILGLHIDSIIEFLGITFAGDNYQHVPAALPFWDAITTVTSIVAMFLLTRKYIEAWHLWVIIDVICIGIYIYKGVYFLALEYTVFLANAVYAVYQWNKVSKNRPLGIVCSQ